MNLLIYYNTNHGNFYQVYTYYLPDKNVGYINQYNHMLVQILANRNNKYINIKSLHDLKRSPFRKESLKSRLAKRLIRWLNKYRE